MARLADKVALITGGARGQGRAMALKFASEGADIVICDACAEMDTVPYTLSKLEDLEETRERVESLGRRCIAVQADVRSLSELQGVADQAIDTFGRIDILCASAGVHSFAHFWEMPEDMWKQVIDINLTGVWNSAKAVVKQMMEQRSGVIIATSSVMGRETGPDLSHYAASKHGVLGIVKSLAYELGPYGIRANALLPSVVHDKMGDNPATREWVFKREGATTEDYVEATRHWHALRGRAALPAAAVADAALWLASDEAMHISGLELVIDAGHSVLPGYNHEPVIDEDIAVGPYADDGVVLPQQV